MDNTRSTVYSNIRPGFDTFLDIGGDVEEFDCGRVMVTRRLELQDTTENRSDRINMRRSALQECNGTVYGRKHVVRSNMRAHSPSGLNKNMIDANGWVDEEILASHYRSVAGNFQARRARITTALDSWDMYENYVGVIASLYSLAWTIEMLTKASRTTVSVLVPPEVLDLPAPTTEDGYWARVALIAQGQFGYARVLSEQPLGSLTNADIIGLSTDPNCRAVEVECWQAPAYDEGDCRISHTKFLEAGFRQGLFLCNNQARRHLVDENASHGWIGNVPDTTHGEALAPMGHRYLIRSESMCALDYWVLMTALYKRQRATPFLCDQDFRCGEEHTSVMFIGNDKTAVVRSAIRDFQEGKDAKSLRVTFDDVMRVLDSFVERHRCYDDAMTARLLFDNYVAQPLPNTVESHVYFNVEWVTDMPIVGMRRAAVDLLLGELPALIQPRALAEMRDLKGLKRSQLSVSLAVNTVWFWGEYLYVAMRSAWDETVSDLREGKVHATHTQTWQSSVISAMVGREQPVPVFQSVGTHFKCASKRCFGASELPVDEPDFDSETAMLARLEEPGGGKYVLHYVLTVPPASTAMIVGLGGTLTVNTPLSPAFLIERPQRFRALRRLVSPTVRANVWASGLVASWNGYDYMYTDGSSQNRNDYLVMWAPNSDNLAPPPVFNSEVAFFNQHQWYRTVERDDVFGDDPYAFMGAGMKRQFRWRTSGAKLHTRYDRRSVPAVDLGTRSHQPMFLVDRVKLEQQFLAGVRAEYDSDVADFRLEQIMVGLVP